MNISITFQFCSKGDLSVDQGAGTWKNQYGKGWEWEATLKWFSVNLTIYRTCSSNEAESGE